MKAIDAMKLAARISGIAITDIGPAVNRSRTYVSSISSRDSCPRADILSLLLKPCGYALVAVPEDDVPTSAIRIDAAE